MLSVGSIVGGGFRLIRERPLAVVVWALVYLAGTAATMSAMRPFFMQWAAIGAADDPQLIVAQMTPLLRWLLLIELAMLVLMIVLIAAPIRAVLRPDRPGFFYLRLGMDELRLFAIAFLFFVLFYVGMILAAIPIALLAGGSVLVAGPGGAVVISFVAMLGVFAAAIWLQVRFSLVFPLTLLRRKIIIGESWRLTRGRFWTLFGAYLVLFVIIFVAWWVVVSITYGSYVSEIMRAGQDPEAIRGIQGEMMSRFTALTPATILTWAAMALIGVLTLALGGGAIATAARELVGPEGDIADTFA